jgi:hypothetical protein
MPGDPAGSAVTGADGRFTIVIPAELLEGKLLLLVATVDGVKIRAVVTPRKLRVIRSQAFQPRGAGEVEEPVVDPISEAASRLLEDEGLENYSDEGVDAVIDAVDTANAESTFDGLTVEEAADDAETTAAADPAVLMALAENRITPTPTPTPTPPCAGDCDEDGAVEIHELVTIVNIGLGDADPAMCEAGDENRDGKLTIDEAVAAVQRGLEGCPHAPVVRSDRRSGQPGREMTARLLAELG